MGSDNAAQSTVYLEYASEQAHLRRAQCYCNTSIGPLDDDLLPRLDSTRPTPCVLALRVFGESALLHPA